MRLLARHSTPRVADGLVVSSRAGRSRCGADGRALARSRRGCCGKPFKPMNGLYTSAVGAVAAALLLARQGTGYHGERHARAWRRREPARTRMGRCSDPTGSTVAEPAAKLRPRTGWAGALRERSRCHASSPASRGLRSVSLTDPHAEQAAARFLSTQAASSQRRCLPSLSTCSLHRHLRPNSVAKFAANVAGGCNARCLQLFHCRH